MTRAALLLACCGACSLGGKPPHYDYFALSATTRAGNSTAMAADRPTVGLNEIAIPGYLDREAIVTRTDDERLVYSPQDRWAEPLDRAFERVLRQELAAALAPSGITVPARTNAPTYSVQVDVLRFERHGTDQIELWARWTVRADGKLERTGETRLQLPIDGPGSARAVAALDQAITRLATDLAGNVRVAARR